MTCILIVALLIVMVFFTGPGWALTIYRRTVGSFAPEVVHLLQTFATQSALAIQNARLFREIEEKNQPIEADNRHKSEFLVKEELSKSSLHCVTASANFEGRVKIGPFFFLLITVRTFV